MKRIFCVIAFTGFFLSLVVHLTTFFGIDPSTHVSWVWVLHIGIFVVFIPMLILQGLTPKKDFWSNTFSNMPKWAKYTIKAFSFYVVINFVLFLFLSKGYVTDERDGKYLLLNHGNIIRELSEEEYYLKRAQMVRGFSGHWMVFYFVAAAVFLYREGSIEDALE